MNTFQAYFINPIDRTLYSWEHEKQLIVKYVNIQHIGGRKFIAHRRIIQISELLSFNEKRMSHIVINCQIDISVVIFLIVEKTFGVRTVFKCYVSITNN